MGERFPEDHCSRWSGIPQDKLYDFHRLCIEIMVRAFRTGVYNLPVNWKNAQIMAAGTFFALRVTIRHPCLATFDFDPLTRLVIGAHDECIRVGISPRNFQHLELSFHPRKRDGSMFERHPTIEDAIADWREPRARATQGGENG